MSNSVDYERVVREIAAVVFASGDNGQKVADVKGILNAFTIDGNDETTRLIQGAKALDSLASKLSANGKHEHANTTWGLSRLSKRG